MFASDACTSFLFIFRFSPFGECTSIAVAPASLGRLEANRVSSRVYEGGRTQGVDECLRPRERTNRAPQKRAMG